MSYVITAEVYAETEVNMGGDKTKVAARTLSERDGTITFNVHGDFEQQAELTKALCNSLIDAGFLDFKIGHSY